MERGEARFDDLPPYVQERLDQTIQSDSLDDARHRVQLLEQTARENAATD